MHNNLSQLLKLPSLEKSLDSGETLFHLGSAVKSVFLVKHGRLLLSRQTPLGTTLTLQVAGPCAVLAEASVYSTKYHCDAIAKAPSVMYVFSKTEFRNQLNANPQLADVWAMSLANSMQAARFRAEIRTLRTVAERLDAWLGAGYQIPEKGQWQDLAAELGVTREALYREFARA